MFQESEKQNILFLSQITANYPSIKTSKAITQFSDFPADPYRKRQTTTSKALDLPTRIEVPRFLFNTMILGFSVSIVLISAER